MKLVNQYIDNVLNNEIVRCEYVLLSVKRHIKDLETAAERGFYFDEKSAQKAILFFNVLTHVKGEKAGRPVELEPWQRFVIAMIFGWKKADGRRKYSYAYVEVAKKNGKTTLAAGIALYMLIMDGEFGAEVYTAATNKDQAKICFDAARDMVLKNRYLKKYLTAYKYNIHSEKFMSRMQALASDSDTLDGKNPHCNIIDEYHAHKTAELFNNLKSGMGARRQPLQFTITTAGFNKQYPCYRYRKTCIEILKGIKRDETLFTIIFTLDSKDDWQNTDNWLKANPNIDVSVTKEYLLNELNQAINNPEEQPNFKTKNLNLWTDQFKTWIADDDFLKCAKLTDKESLRGRDCYLAIDLSSTRDITALCALFPDYGNDCFDVLWFFFCPELTARERVRKDGVNYDIWINEGYIIETPGNVVDYNYIYAFITGKTQKGETAQFEGLADMYNILSLPYDRWNSSQLMIDLTEVGLPVSPYGQGFASMSAPTKEFEKLILKELLRHDGNPVARWMLSNVELRTDPAGNIKIDKAKSSEKVDGIVSAVMALGEYMTAQGNGQSKYETEELIIL